MAVIKETQKAKIERLEKEIEEWKALYEECLNKNIELQNQMNELQQSQATVKNERGAGRHKRFTEEDIQNIKMMRKLGAKIRTIASTMNCSVGLVHKIINEQDQ